MELRLCEKINRNFIPHKSTKTICTHEDAVAWSTIQKYLLNLSKESSKSSTPRQLWISFCFAEAIPTIMLSNSHVEETNLTLQGVKDIIPKAENEGLKVEYDSLFKEITFTFTPSNY